MATQERKKYEETLWNLRPGGHTHVRAVEWQQFLTDHSDIQMISGHGYRLKAEDAAGGMVRVWLVDL